MTKQSIYVSIDLKSFYASVECQSLGLDPLTTNLVVADNSRSDKTICLAISPALKSMGISGRPRLFEVKQKIKEINAKRRRIACGKRGESSSDLEELTRQPWRPVDFIIAPPRMATYIQTSNRIYQLYLKYVDVPDIHVYSIDEVFIDITHYLKGAGCTAYQFVTKILLDILATTGLTATAGIGTNLYLCKVAMDIVAKQIKPNQDGVRIATLDEKKYRKLLWNHRPLTDFWRIGQGLNKKLEELDIFTMADLARFSLDHEEVLYQTFGVNAELLIDHAWGYETCTMQDIKSYQPSAHSLGTGQVLHEPYSYEKGLLIAKEMTELLSLDLCRQQLVTNQLVLTVGYDIECLRQENIREQYHGKIKEDVYGRKIPASAHGTIHLQIKTCSTKRLLESISELYQRIVNPKLLIRRVNISANQVVSKVSLSSQPQLLQMDLFTDYQHLEKELQEEKENNEREMKVQEALVEIKQRYGKNAVMKGMNLLQGATTQDRNRQIGGHRA